jgi:hypothetical protein
MNMLRVWALLSANVRNLAFDIFLAMATTTLRIDEGLYRETKSAAARQGTTVTRFIEDALRLKLRLVGAPRKPEEIELPTFASGKGFPFPPKALKKLAQRSEREHDESRHLIPRRKAR